MWTDAILKPRAIQQLWGEENWTLQIYLPKWSGSCLLAMKGFGILIGAQFLKEVNSEKEKQETIQKEREREAGREFRPGKDLPFNHNLNIQTWDNLGHWHRSIQIPSSQRGPSCYGEVDVQLAAIGSMGPFPAEVLPAAHRSDALHSLRQEHGGVLHVHQFLQRLPRGELKGGNWKSRTGKPLVKPWEKLGVSSRKWVDFKYKDWGVRFTKHKFLCRNELMCRNSGVQHHPNWWRLAHEWWVQNPARPRDPRGLPLHETNSGQPIVGNPAGFSGDPSMHINVLSWKKLGTATTWKQCKCGI